jgi:DNA-binding NarL/FixJ family response regulator
MLGVCGCDDRLYVTVHADKVNPTYSVSEPKKTVRCVLAEDQGMLRELLTLAISAGTKFDVVAQAENGVEALNLCRQLQPDILITDVMLPAMRGNELVARLSKEFPDMRFLGISSHEQPILLQQMVDAGVHGFVIKNSRWSTMIQALETVMNGDPYFCPKTQTLLETTVRTKGKSTSNLSFAEQELVRLLAAGVPISEIASLLSLSEKTVRNRITNVKHKLGITNAAGLVQYALERGLTPSGSLPEPLNLHGQ